MDVLKFVTSGLGLVASWFPLVILATGCNAAGQEQLAEEPDPSGQGGQDVGGSQGDPAGAQAGGGQSGASVGQDAGASMGGTGGAFPRGDDAAMPSDGFVSGTPTFVAVGYSGIRVASRDLGKTWVDAVTSGGGGDDPNLLRGVGCGNGLCVAGGGSAGATGRLLTTADGKIWKEFMSGSAGLSDVAFGNDIWVGVSGHYAVRSADGYKWEVNTDKGALNFGGILRRMVFAGGKFIAWGDGGKRVLSTDGRAWKQISSGAPWGSLAFGNGLFVAVGSSRQTSVDGVSWTSAGGPGGGWIVWTGKAFVYGGSDGNVYSSPDGQTWQSTKGSNVPQEGVAYGAGVFVSYGATSTDGVKWVKATAPAAYITDVDFAYLAAKL